MKTGSHDLTEAQAALLRSHLEHLKYELIPLKNVLRQAAFLPDGAAVSVTASPGKGMAATIDLALDLQQMGLDVVPHISARLTTSKAELESMLARLEAADIDRVFVVGGDVDEPGEFFDALAVIEAMADMGHHFTEIGVTGYPEGHPFIEDDALDAALSSKVAYASYSTTQMCFTPSVIGEWVYRQRDRGIAMPFVIGIPGVAELRKLVGISARIGVGDSMRFLSKNTSLVGRLARPGGYTPDDLMVGLLDVLADARADITGFHVYTFNQVETTERWRNELLAELSESLD